MKLPLVVKPLAEADIAEAYDWYLAKGGVELAEAFTSALDAFLGRIESDPRFYAVLTRGVRLGCLERFPYIVCYRVTRKAIEVLAVYHAGRDPSIWKSRLS